MSFREALICLLPVTGKVYMKAFCFQKGLQQLAKILIIFRQ
jgi:hypothetical protein